MTIKLGFYWQDYYPTAWSAIVAVIAMSLCGVILIYLFFKSIDKLFRKPKRLAKHIKHLKTSIDIELSEKRAKKRAKRKQKQHDHRREPLPNKNTHLSMLHSRTDSINSTTTTTTAATITLPQAVLVDRTSNQNLNAQNSGVDTDPDSDRYTTEQDTDGDTDAYTTDGDCQIQEKAISATSGSFASSTSGSTSTRQITPYSYNEKNVKNAKNDNNSNNAHNENSGNKLNTTGSTSTTPSIDASTINLLTPKNFTKSLITNNNISNSGKPSNKGNETSIVDDSKSIAMDSYSYNCNDDIFLHMETISEENHGKNDRKGKVKRKTTNDGTAIKDNNNKDTKDNKDNKDNKETALANLHSQRTQITQISWYNKSLLLSSIFWSMIYIFSSLVTVGMIIFFDKRIMSCGTRSLVFIPYGLQRISLMLFFILRLYFSFVNTNYQINYCKTIIFVLITFIIYSTSASTYIILSFTFEDGFDCHHNAFFPLMFSLFTDMIWNIFLASFFMHKLKQVKPIYVSFFACFVC